MNFFKSSSNSISNEPAEQNVQHEESSIKIRWKNKVPTIENLGQIFLFSPKTPKYESDKGKIYICRICHNKILYADTKFAPDNISVDDFTKYYWIGPIPGESFV